MKERKISKMVQGFATQDGAGVKLTRVLSNETIKEFDPFLMLDSFDSTDPEDYIKGFPWHPHRGIETLTYLIYGKIEHQDNLGNKGNINNGESQWMTAGSGILHQEMPQVSERMLGFQLWINMQSKDKMALPKYNNVFITDDNILSEDGKIVRVISGNYNQKVSGFSPKYDQASVFDISLEKNKSITIQNKPENTVFILTIENQVMINNEQIPVKTAVLLKEGDQITVSCTNEVARFIYFEGTPLHESIAWGGPIVMNTQQELQQAFKELEDGSFIK